MRYLISYQVDIVIEQVDVVADARLLNPDRTRSRDFEISSKLTLT